MRLFNNHRPTRSRTTFRPRGRPAATLAAALLTAALAAGCGTAGAAGDPGAVVVTVTSTVPSKPPPSAEPQTGPTPPAKPGKPTPPTTRSASPPSAKPAKPSKPSEPASPTTRATSKPGGAASSTGGKTVTPPGSLSTGDLIAAATSAAAAAGVRPADPDAPGPPTGPPCSADHQYVDEATTGLRSDVVTAWKAAVTAAHRKGITLCLNDGKRSRAQQQAQFDQYVTEYGKEVAQQLVLPPEKSAHVVGIAVDAQPADGYRWLQATGGSLGFCRIYDNEPWHFEYNPAYRTEGCPARLPKPEG